VSGGNIPRLQGTDGVRRPVLPAKDAHAAPLEAFLEHGVMTEEFFELYCYAHVRGLIGDGRMEEGDEVLIGWDSRDTRGFYTSRAVTGIAKAGGMPVLLGIMPTPGVAISLVCLEASTAFMITASHNPKDQNGIKIFMGPGAAKFMPDDDEKLTRRIFETDYAALSAADIKFSPFDAAADERKRFINFHMDPRNTWLPPGDMCFANTALVVDAAHGALAGLAAMVFSQLAFGRVIEVAGEQNGDVNKNSGVAYLEGIREIKGDVFDRGSGISSHQLVKKMFAEGRAMKAAAQETALMGVSFDADGDRFYPLFYEAKKDAVHVLSGDESLALQAEFLMKTDPDRYRGSAFAYTVESDINVARHAEKLGFKPHVMAVGDKWILAHAQRAPLSFGIGGEETGHSIHEGIIPVSCRDEKRIFAGNGLKGAINTLIAAHRLTEGMNATQAATALARPFEPGFKQSLYAYYIDKSLFARESEAWKETETVIREAFAQSAPSGYSLEPELIADEPDMLYIKIIRSGEGQAGSVFVRNSGTEDKIGVNVRGARGMENFLGEIGGRAIFRLMKTMKNSANPMALAEARLLATLAENEQPDKGSFAGIDFDRLVYEMEMKQKLIGGSGGMLVLTPLGRGIIG